MKRSNNSQINTTQLGINVECLYRAQVKNKTYPNKNPTEEPSKGTWICTFLYMFGTN